MQFKPYDPINNQCVGKVIGYQQKKSYSDTTGYIFPVVVQQVELNGNRMSVVCMPDGGRGTFSADVEDLVYMPTKKEYEAAENTEIERKEQNNFLNLKHHPTLFKDRKQLILEKYATFTPAQNKLFDSELAARGIKTPPEKMKAVNELHTMIDIMARILWPNVEE